MNIKKIFCVSLLSIVFWTDQSAARLRENTTVSAFVYPASGRFVPLEGAPGARVEMRVQIPTIGFDETYRGTTDLRGGVVFARLALNPALSPLMVIYSVKAEYVSPANGLIKSIYHSADFSFSQAARATPSGDFFLNMNIPVNSQ